jgi:hypothetical protein
MTKNIDGYDGKYMVSDNGTITSVYRISNIHGVLMKVGKPKVLRPSKDKKGYLVVNLYDGAGNAVQEKVHRLVAEAFLDNPENKRCVCHKDNNPQNCHVSNLYWGTDRENQDQAWSDGIHKSEVAVKQISLSGEEVATYRSQAAAAMLTGITQQNISKCISGKRQSAGGYRWQRLD